MLTPQPRIRCAQPDTTRPLSVSPHALPVRRELINRVLAKKVVPPVQQDRTRVGRLPRHARRVPQETMLQDRPQLLAVHVRLGHTSQVLARRAVARVQQVWGLSVLLSFTFSLKWSDFSSIISEFICKPQRRIVLWWIGVDGVHVMYSRNVCFIIVIDLVHPVQRWQLSARYRSS
jgi:hypothetical protein